MSGATCSNRVKLEGQIITVATVQGTSQDVFAAQTFTLQRLRWVEDGEVTVCQGCGNKFSQLRRKHHCRQCGDIYCAKCCKDKMVLPHIECPTSERVCDGCKSVAQLLVKGVDTSMGSKLEAARGLVQCIRGTDERNNSQELLDMGFTSLKKVLELGGLQMLVHLARNSNAELQEVLVPGLHSLVTHAPLHPHLLRAGVLSALARILSARNARCKETLEFSLEALLILCKSSETKVKAVHSGIVEPVLDLAKSGSPEVTLLALTCLSCLFESPDTHSVALNNPSLLGDLLELADTTDEQVQEVTLRILAYLVMGDNDDEIKVNLSKMDSSNKKIFQRALQSRPKNPQLLCTCACLVANLATAQGAQHFICDYSIWLGNLVENFPTNSKVLQHATRGLANMAHYSQHSSTLIQMLPLVRDTCIKGQDEASKQQAVRMVLSLLVHSTHAVITTLTSEGVSEFLQALVSMPNTLAALQSEICRSVPTLSPPV